MDGEALKRWRKTERDRLVAERAALAKAQVDAWRTSMDQSIERSFPGLARCKLGFCWPIKNEYDARHIAKTLRERGAVTAMPVVVAPRQPLKFREWHPGVTLA